MVGWDGARWFAENRLFILGAGFSALAGVPLTSELFDRAMKLCREESPWFIERMDGFARDCFQIEGEPDYSTLDLAKLATHLEYDALTVLGGGENWSALGSKRREVSTRSCARSTRTASRPPRSTARRETS